jgi:hypothetical protein
MTVSAFPNPFGCLLRNFLTGEFLGSVANSFCGFLPVRSMSCGLTGKGMGDFVQDHLL